MYGCVSVSLTVRGCVRGKRKLRDEVKSFRRSATLQNTHHGRKAEQEDWSLKMRWRKKGREVNIEREDTELSGDAEGESERLLSIYLCMYVYPTLENLRFLVVKWIIFYWVWRTLHYFTVNELNLCCWLTDLYWFHPRFTEGALLTSTSRFSFTVRKKRVMSVIQEQKFLALCEDSLCLIVRRAYNTGWCQLLLVTEHSVNTASAFQSINRSIHCSENKDGVVAAVCVVVDRLPSSSW